VINSSISRLPSILCSKGSVFSRFTCSSVSVVDIEVSINCARQSSVSFEVKLTCICSRIIKNYLSWYFSCSVTFCYSNISTICLYVCVEASYKVCEVYIHRKISKVCINLSVVYCYLNSVCPRSVVPSHLIYARG